MEAETRVDEKGNDILLKTLVIIIILICMGVIKAVGNNGSSANFAGRTKWLAISILKMFPRVYSNTSKSVFQTKQSFDKFYRLFAEIWDAVFSNKGEV